MALGVDAEAIRKRRGYLIWEVGKPPDFVLEVASQSTVKYDCTGKRDLYAAMGVGEYWRYDRTGDEYYGIPLIGERLVNGEYLPFEVHTAADGEIWAHSPVLDLDIYWGDDRLRVYDSDYRGFIPAVDAMMEANQEIEEALASTQAAYEAERTARMQAEAEVARLREQLRRQQSE